MLPSDKNTVDLLPAVVTGIQLWDGAEALLVNGVTAAQEECF